MDYYLDPDEPPGRWWGRGRAGLGVDGTVTGEQLRAVLDGHHPETGSVLGRRFGAHSARGFDATFSAPKSVSVLWALTPDPWVRAEVLAAHNSAVDAALDWFEQHGAVTRRGRDGVFQVDTAGITAAVFRQHMSRTMDPQLHSHAVIAAKVQDPAGRWLSLDARFLKFQQRSIGTVYDAALRAELSARLGVAWVDRGDGVYDLACVPEQVRDGFSKRSGQVDAKLGELVRRWSDEHDGAPPDVRTIARLERAAALASRPAKSHVLDAATLHTEWIAEAQALGFEPAVLVPEGIVGTGRQVGRIPDEDLIDEALLHASEESATWLRADLARHLATILDASTATTGEALVAEIERLAALAEACCVALGPASEGNILRRRDDRPVTEHVTDRRLTILSVLAQEHDLQVWAATSTRRVEPVEDPQVAATEAIASEDPLVLVVGPAGTGKTTATARAVAALQTEGRSVVGLAPSGKAADILAREASGDTDTVAAFLARHHRRPSPWPAGTTVILDEAGMTATADLARLAELVRDNGWRLVAVGDPQQLPSVSRGGVFAHWCHTLPTHTLEQPRRFAERWEAAASLQLRDGHSEAVAAYAAHGRIRSTHPALVAGEVAAAHQRHETEGRTIAITVTNAETARAINREIQRLNKSRGPGVDLHDGTTVHVGDRIATRRNDPTLRTGTGERVRNRHTWTVVSVDSNGSLTVTHPERGSVELPARYVAEHVELGWAVTGYGNQGDTVDVGIAVLDTTASRNHAYVAMTRGRHANHALLLDATGTQDPAELFGPSIARPANGYSALAVQAQLHHAAGLQPPADRARDRLAASGSPEPDEPPSAVSLDVDLQAKVDALNRRLDRIQERRAARSGPSLGL